MDWKELLEQPVITDAPVAENVVTFTTSNGSIFEVNVNEPRSVAELMEENDITFRGRMFMGGVEITGGTMVSPGAQVDIIGQAKGG